MRAWRVSRYGDFHKVLHLTEVPTPTPGEQVLVRPHAGALGFADILACEGRYQDRPDVPWTGGLDAIAGTVVDPGPATHLAAGDRVVGLPRAPAGGWAEVVALPHHRVFPVHPKVSSSVAAAMFTGFHTAHYGLVDRAGLRPEDAVLVLAGAGAVGSAAIQLAHRAGAFVVATGSTEAKRLACQRFGADIVLAPSDDLAAEVLAATNGAGVDLVVDPVGGTPNVAALRCLAPEGRLVVVGFASGEIPTIRLSRLLLRNVTLIGAYWGAALDRSPDRMTPVHTDLMDLAAAGAITVPIEDELPFDSVPGALERIQARTVTGKLVVRLEDASMAHRVGERGHHG